MTIEPITTEGGSLIFDVSALNGTIVDKCGNAIVNTDTTVTNFGGTECMYFNGTTSKLDLGSDLIGVGEFTVSAWIYIKSWGESSVGRIIDNGRFLMNVYGTISAIRNCRDGTTLIVSPAGSILLNRWYHIVVTSTANGTTNFYINASTLGGALNQAGGTPAAGTTNVIIGNNNAQTATFDGYMAFVRGYNRVLTTTEITNIYNQYK